MACTSHPWESITLEVGTTKKNPLLSFSRERESRLCPDKRPSGSIYARPLVGEAFSRGQSNQNSFHWKNKTFPFLFSSPFYQETDRTARQIGDGRENKQITKNSAVLFSFFPPPPPQKVVMSSSSLSVRPIEYHWLSSFASLISALVCLVILLF